MLTVEKNQRLTRVGPGTPMGELPRRDRWPTERRVLGEDLVLHRGGSAPSEQGR